MARKYDERERELHDEGVREEELKSDLANSASSMQSPGQEMQSSRRKYEVEAKDIVASQTTAPVENTNEVTVDFRDFVRKEDAHQDTRENHIIRLREAMRIIEEEIRHIELRSENI
ncbi:MAG: hypothetical protein AABX10_00945 [Nanoarchaeota archaeon]